MLALKIASVPLVAHKLKARGAPGADGTTRTVSGSAKRSLSKKQIARLDEKYMGVLIGNLLTNLCWCSILNSILFFKI
jgi:hypothetical protein